MISSHIGSPEDVAVFAPWTAGALPTDEADLGILTSSGADNLTARLVKQVFVDHRNGIELPSAPPREVLAALYRKIIAEIDWTQEAAKLREQSLTMLQSLRLVSSGSEVTLPRNGKPSWYAAAVFLQVWGDEKADHELDDVTIRSFLDFKRVWLADAAKGSPRRPQNSTTDFDETYSMDWERRSFAQGSTKKPGSHGDKRGHK